MYYYVDIVLAFKFLHLKYFVFEVKTLYLYAKYLFPFFVKNLGSLNLTNIYKAQYVEVLVKRLLISF